MLNATQWEALKTVVAQALERAPDAREDWLRAACAADPALLAEALALLAAATGADAFEPDDGADVDDDDEGPWIGRRLGAYRIDAELPGGGMGRVFAAHRDDGAYTAAVAIKKLRAGVDTAEARRRFQAERRILAGLRHPNIASLLDSGTVDGTPYFVMEYVDGLPIDRHCGARRLGIEARLRLFGTVCGAVEFAHQRLVVHRDLKPENILVQPDGTPKLLDFGIAKLLDDDAGAEHLTRLGASGPYTPAYAAPEQLQGGTISTATDVYALGCVLYRLLSGRLPFDTLSARGAEWARAVAEDARTRPSEALRRPPMAQDAALRAGLPAPDALAARLRLELDWIVLKAIAPEPALRYATVAELHADVRAVLEGRVVVARRPSWRYRARKFALRNRLALGLGALTVASVVAGVAGVLWQAHQAQILRVRAENRLAEVETLSEKLVFEYQARIADLAGGVPVATALAADVSNFLDGLDADGSLSPRARVDLAMAYRSLATVQNGFRRANQGDVAGGARSLAKSLAILDALVAQSDRDPGWLPPAAAQPDAHVLTRHELLLYTEWVERDMMRDAERRGASDEAGRHIERARVLTERAVALQRDDLELAYMQSDLAQFRAYHQGRYGEALALSNRAVGLVEAALRADPKNDDTRATLSRSLVASGLYLREGFDDLAGARALFLRGIEQDRIMHAHRPDSAEFTGVLIADGYQAANNDMSDGLYEDAGRWLLEARQTMTPLLRADPNDVYKQYVAAMIDDALARYYRHVGRRAEEGAAWAAARAGADRLLAKDPSSSDYLYLSALAWSERAAMLMGAGDVGGALAAFGHTSALLGRSARSDRSMARRLQSERADFADGLLAARRWDALLAFVDDAPSAPAAASTAGDQRRIAVRLDLARARAWDGKAAAGTGAARAAAAAHAQDAYRAVVALLQPAIDAGTASQRESGWYEAARAGLH